MAIYHFHDRVISRGKGQSVVAAAAYQSRARLYNERDGETKDYSRKAGQDCLFSGVYVPKDAPAWAKDPERLWNGVERAEDQHNRTRARSATLAHGLDIGLMAELTPEQNRYALQDFIRETYVRHGYGVQASLHGPEQGGDARNIHAHLLVTIRTLDGDGFSPKKASLDRGEMQQQVRQWREAWAQTASRHLRRHGFTQEAERMASSHLTLEEQRQAALKRGDTAHAETLARDATEHLGPKATRRERDGIKTERGEINRKARAQAENRETLHRWKAQTEQAIAEEEARLQAQRQTEARPQAREPTPNPTASWWQAMNARAALHTPIPDNENQPEPPQRENAPRTPAARAFKQAQEPERTPQPEPPRRRTVQRETFNTSARPQESPPPRPASIEDTHTPTADFWKADRLKRAEPEEDQRPTEARRKGDGGDSQTQTHTPANENKRRPRAKTAEEMRARRSRGGRERTREPDRD